MSLANNPAAQTPADRLAGGSAETRLAALREILAALPGGTRRGTNLHIHTNESFSVFRSPSDAVAQAAREGLSVLGINDHYTVAGHDEFRAACQAAKLPATFSLEAIAMDRDAEREKTLLNDPDNPGRVYLCGKGVSAYPADDAPGVRMLTGMREAMARRSREMAEKAAGLFLARLKAEGPKWEDVRSLTPRGNTTERHVAQAILFRVQAVAREKGVDGLRLLADLCGAAAPAGANDAALQNFIRSKLLKSGGPCFVRESEDAFVSIADMRSIFLAFRAIPTYPILGNPVTGGEKDVNALLDRLEGLGFLAVEVIPQRNTRERLSEILAAARARHWPVFNGTEHNSPEAKPLLDQFSLDPEFEPWFRSSAELLLGHQRLAASGQGGFVGADGRPSIADAAARFERCAAAGRL